MTDAITRPITPPWFTITEGKHKGRRHIKGWMLTAIKTADDAESWLALAVCPRCHALVINDDQHAYGEQSWAHEQWHAATDYPDEVT